MKKFKYVGKKRGKKMKGEIEADGLVQARSKLRTEGIRDVKLTAIKEKKKAALAIFRSHGGLLGLSLRKKS